MDKQRLLELAGINEGISADTWEKLSAVLHNAEQEFGKDNEVVQYFTKAFHAIDDFS